MVSKLPPQQQKIYRLSREQYLTWKQIADQLNISADTVSNHMASAMYSIRKQMASEALTIISATATI